MSRWNKLHVFVFRFSVPLNLCFVFQGRFRDDILENFRFFYFFLVTRLYMHNFSEAERRKLSWDFQWESKTYQA